MLRCLLRTALLGCLLLGTALDMAMAQDTNAVTDTTQYYRYYRADNSPYFKGRLGLNFYGGDRDVNPDNEIQKYIENIGFSLGLEVGYHLAERFSLGLLHLSGRYPRIEDNRPEPEFPPINQDLTSKWRHHFSLVGRSLMLPRSRISPYGQIGFHVGLGKINDEMRTGIGPMTGVGIDAAVNDRIGIFIELDGFYSYGDEKLDLADTEVPADASDFDAFTFFGFGLRVNLRSPLIPVEVRCVTPEMPLVVGQAGDFRAELVGQPTRPVTFEWDFGDQGGLVAGQFVPGRAFDQPGTYNVTVTAENRVNRDTAVCPVRVIAPPRIQTLTPVDAIDVCEPLTPVQFRATVEGEDVQYAWDFGDGSTSTAASPTHTYTRPGSYTVTLRVTNSVGTDTRTTRVTVNPCPVVCDVTQLNSVFFDRNSSVLSPAAQAALRENIEVVLECPDVCIEIVGYASRDERNPQRLSEDRARSVEAFYIDGGLEASRLTVRGAGATGQTTKKGGATQFRRVDSLPGLCVDR